MDRLRKFGKRRFPTVSKRLADLVRWTFRVRNDFGQELRYGRLLQLAGSDELGQVLEIGRVNSKSLEVARRAQWLTVCDLGGASRCIAAHGPSTLRQVVGDVRAAPFPAGQFDTVFMVAVFEHVPDDTAAAKELWRILKPGGRLLVYVPDKDQHEPAWSRGEYPGHVRPGYSPDELRQLLENADFEVTFLELGNGPWAAVMGEIYGEVCRLMPWFRFLPRWAVKPFIFLVSFDGRSPGSLRWGLFCEGVKKGERTV